MGYIGLIFTAINLPRMFCEPKIVKRESANNLKTAHFCMIRLIYYSNISLLMIQKKRIRKHMNTNMSFLDQDYLTTIRKLLTA